MSNSVFLNYGTSYFDLLSQRIDDNEAEITDVDFLKLNKPDPINPNALLYVVDVDGNTGSSEILCQANNALQSVGCLQLPGTAVNPASVIPELSGQDATTVWLSSVNGHLYRGSVDLESGGGGGGGDVVGPASSVNEAIARFDGTSGKIIQNSATKINDLGTIDFSENAALRLNGTTLLTMDRVDKSVGVGRYNNREKMIMIGTAEEGDSNIISNGGVIGNDSCVVASSERVDVWAIGNEIGTASGNTVIAFGNRISALPTAISSLGTKNILMGHDMTVRNGSLANCCVGHSSVLRGNANCLYGNEIFKLSPLTASNVCVGYGIGSSFPDTVSVNNNTFIGTSILSSATGSSSSNIIIGETVGSAITTGVNNCLWIGASGVNGEAETVRVGNSTKVACYVGGIFGGTVGNRALITKVDSNGKLFSSTVARQTANITSGGIGEGDEIALTTSFATIAPNTTNNSYADVINYSFPANGTIQYNGLFTGDTAVRSFRASFVLNHTGFTNNARLAFAVSGTPGFIEYALTGSAGTFTMSGIVVLTPGQTVSCVAKTDVAETLDIQNMNLFIELLK